MNIYGGRLAARRRGGFTIVELLIVIVVLAILVAISLVVYNGVQGRARDASRMADLQQVSGALQLYANRKGGDWIGAGSNCGVYGNGSGWLSAGPDDLSANLYPRSILECLQDDGILGEGAFLDPTGCIFDSGGICGSWKSIPAQAYMKATCKKNGRPVTYLLAHLETKEQKKTEIDNLCDLGSLVGYSADGQRWGTNYGMNYYVELK